VINAIKAGEEISGWKYADLTVGAAGTASAAVLLAAGTLTSPIVVTTLTIVATGAMIYGGVRLLNDLLN
jgi:hypothetical protein